MALRQHSQSILDIGTRASHSEVAHDPTSLTEWFNGPSQIIIGGHARVQLGDQYNNGFETNPIRRLPALGRDQSNLSAVCTVLQVIDFCAAILSTDDHRKDNVYGSVHVRLASATLQSFQPRLSTLITSLDRLPSLGNKVLAEVLNGSFAIAEALIAALDAVYNAAAGHDYADLRQIVDTICAEDQVAEMLILLKNLRERALLATLIFLRPELIKTEATNIRTTENTERILLSSVRQLREKHTLAVDDLFRATNMWFGLSWSDTKLAAERWLSLHAPVVADHAVSIAEKMLHIRIRSLRLHLLSSLTYPEMDRRYHAITQAQSRTFAWLYDDTDESICSKYNFARWLQNSDPTSPRLYWIRGKPGSGKSILMRYLLDDLRTRRLAQTWSGHKSLIVASCFFWGSGTELQKSQEGLLQTLLRQLLTPCNDFPRELFPSRWSMLELGSDFDQTWSAGELRDAIFQFVVKYVDTFTILILIDGLDEYQGTDIQRQDVCSLLKELSQHVNVKICASSRPWNVYKDAFRSTPRLRLEQLTKVDIRNFIEDSLGANEHFHNWALVERDNAEHLISAMAYKASGVFLWVHLVVRSVLIGLQNGDDVWDLDRRLRDIPADLEDLFRRLLSQLEPFYLESASRTFQLALRQSSHGHLVIVYHFIQEYGGKSQATTLPTLLNSTQIIQRQDIQERRINAQCMGLLEFIPMDEGRMRPFHTVEFLHRTAKDFMASDEMYQKILSWRSSPWDVDLALLEAHVRLLQSCDPELPWMHISAQFTHLTTILKQLAQVADPHRIYKLLETGETHFNSLIQAARSLSLWIEHGNFNSFFGLLDRDQTDFLGLAVQEGAIPYVLSRLPNLSSTELRKREGRPLLDFALTSRSAKRSAPSLALVTALLTLGASPNDLWDRSTVWARYLKHLRECKFPPETIDTFVEVTRVLLSAGASDEIYDTEGRRIDVPCKEIIIRAVFPRKNADDLISSFGGPLDYLQAQTAKFRLWLKSPSS